VDAALHCNPDHFFDGARRKRSNDIEVSDTTSTATELAASINR
jgi:hypothetical protein